MSTIQNKILCLFIFLFSGISYQIFADEKLVGCRLEEKEKNGKIEITMENEYIKLVLIPEYGGRCSRLIYKKTSKDLTYFGPYYESDHGGLFQTMLQPPHYRGYGNLPFRYKILENTRERIKIVLWQVGEEEGKDIQLERTITLESGKSNIKVDYTVQNVSVAETKTIVVQFHHVLRAGDKDQIAEKNTFYGPMKDGIIQVKFPEQRGDVWGKDVVAGWNGVVGESSTGAVCMMDYKTLKSLYWWLDTKNDPTFEWFTKKIELKAGQNFKTTYNILPFSGFYSIEGAKNNLVGSIYSEDDKFEINKDIECKIFINSGEKRDVKVYIGYRIFPGEDITPLKSEAIALTTDNVESIPVSFKPAKEGTYVLIVLVHDEKAEKILEFEKPFVIGNTSGEYTLKPEEAQQEEGSADITQEKLEGLELDKNPVKWCIPNHEGTMDVLFLVNKLSIREILELSRRIDLNYYIVPYYRSGYIYTNRGLEWPGEIKDEEILRLKTILEKKTFDCMVIGSLQYSAIPKDIQKLILQKVEKGMGLIIVDPPEPPKEKETGTETLLEKVVEENNKEKINIMKNIEMPIDQPELMSITKKTYGEGIIVKTALFYWGMTSHIGKVKWGVNRGLYLSQVDELTYPYWEYYYAYWCKLIPLASKKNSKVVISSLSVLKQNISSKTNNEIEVNIKNDSKEKSEAKVLVEFKDKYYNKVKEDKKTVLINSGESIIFKSTSPGFTEDGLYFINIFLMDKEDKIFDSGSLIFEVKSPYIIKDVKTDKEIYEQTEPVKVSLNINGKEEFKNIYLFMELTDIYGRLIDNVVKELPQGKKIINIEHIFLVEQSLSKLVNLSICLKSQKGEIYNIVNKDIWIKKDNTITDYTPYACYWTGGTVQYHLMEPMLKILKSLGFTGAGSGAPGEIELLAKYNLRHTHMGLAEIDRVADSSTPKPWCIHNPGYLKKAEEAALRYLDRTKKYPAFMGYLGDETCLSKDEDLCFCNFSLNAYRKDLKDKYIDIEKLNKQWGTEYKSWEEIVPWDTVKAKKSSDNIGQWLDFRVFMTRSFTNYFAGIAKILRDKIGVSSGLNIYYENPYACTLESMLIPTIGLAQTYPQFFDRARSYRINDKDFFLWSGYIDTEGKYYHDPWWVAAYGGGITGFYEARGYTNWHFLSDTMGMKNRTVWIKESLEDLVKGVGKTLMESKVEENIVIFQSYLSQFTYSVEEGEKNIARPTYESYYENWATIVRDLKYGYRFIAEDQINERELLKYKVLIMPYVSTISDFTIEKIKEFLSNGGIVIADVRFAVRNEHGRIRDNFEALENIFGVSRQEDNFKYKNSKFILSALAKNKGITIDEINVGGKEEDIRVTEGEVLANYKDNIPAVILKKSGNGSAIYINGLIPNNESALEFTREILGMMNVKPYINITNSDGKEQRGTLAVKRKRSNIEYITILRHYKNEGIKNSVITIPDKTHLYDVRTHKYYGKVNSIKEDIEAGRAVVLALLPYIIEDVKLKVDKSKKRGENLEFQVEIKGTSKEIGDHPIRIEFYNPDGLLIEAYTKNEITDKGKYKESIWLSLNEKLGTWKIVVREIISGKEVSKNIIIE